MSLARDERTELADFIAGLTAEQWDAPTLCDGWRVRDVIAHVYSYEDVGLARVAGRMLRSGFDTDRNNARTMAEFADRDPDELVARARACVQPRGLTSMMGGRIALTDGMIHQQDIRRPLGMPREIPAERIVVALATAVKAPTINGAARVKDLTLAATDVDWTHGAGPAVEGPAEALLMAIAGRAGITDELSGPGVATLAGRIGS